MPASASLLLLLLLPLQAGLILGSDREVAIQEPITLRVTWTSSFYNRSSAEHLVSSWLDDLEVYRWNSSSATIMFLYPWSRGNFSLEWTELERIVLSAYTTFHAFIIAFQFEYPVELQLSKGCQLQPGETIVSFFQVAYHGSDFLSFQNNSFVPSPKGGQKAQKMSRRINQNPRNKELIVWLLDEICPRYLLGLLEAGKAHLQRQEKPEAWLSKGPSPRPGRLQLVCHVSGFYPKPVWVMWMRGEQEQRETQRGDVLPNADETWYLRVSLEVAAGEAAGLSCRVKHSSLGGRDIVLHWEHRGSLGVILVAVIAALALLTGLVFWFMKRWTHCEASPNAVPLQ